MKRWVGKSRPLSFIFYLYQYLLPLCFAFNFYLCFVLQSHFSWLVYIVRGHLLYSIKPNFELKIALELLFFFLICFSESLLMACVHSEALEGTIPPSLLQHLFSPECAEAIINQHNPGDRERWKFNTYATLQ